jgi:Mor family transcriptional regulator
MITLDDFPDGFREIVNAIGIDAAVALCEIAGGTQIYIPKVDSIDRVTRNQQLYKDYLAGKTFTQLANEYRLSENTVRNIVFDLHRQRTNTIENYL